jgi:hypothetical protein
MNHWTARIRDVAPPLSHVYPLTPYSGPESRVDFCIFYIIMYP